MKRKIEKTKVSFDLSNPELEDVEAYCRRKGFKRASFFREAVREKLEKENQYMDIFFFYENSIKNVTVDTRKWEIRLRDASKEMVKNAQAIQEGTLEAREFPNETVEAEKTAADPIISFETGTYVIEDILSEDQVLKFFTREKYPSFEEEENQDL